LCKEFCAIRAVVYRINVSATKAIPTSPEDVFPIDIEAFRIAEFHYSSKSLS
jgi:hypothetical protein